MRYLYHEKKYGERERERREREREREKRERERERKYIKTLKLIKVDEIVCNITDFSIVLKEILLVKKFKGRISSRKKKDATLWKVLQRQKMLLKTGKIVSLKN